MKLYYVLSSLANNEIIHSILNLSEKERGQGNPANREDYGNISVSFPTASEYSEASLNIRWMVAAKIIMIPLIQ